STLLIDDVISSTFSSSHVLYQRASMVQEDVAPLVLRDRETGEDVVLVEAFPIEQGRTLTDTYVRLEGPGHWGDASTQRWFWASDGREFWAPGDTSIMAVLSSGGAWLIGYDAASHETELFRWREAELPARVVSCRDCVDVTYNGWRGGVQVRRGPGPGSETELWFARDDGGEPELLAPRVTRNFLQLADDRVLTVLGEERGPLVLHDYRDPGEHVLDPRVAAPSIFLTMLFNVDGDVLYQVDDPDRGRALYLARLAAVQ
ncbi:MAG TPA: hypothetical protein VFG69_15035, partial [Nannocystaceae bacterium]|nr:hypothetical protein [Nannocystaceae bacterium]